MPKYNTETHEQAIGFVYPSIDEPILQQLRSLVAIDIPAEASELDKTRALIGYAHTLFTHNGDGIPSANDPVTILTEAKAGKSFRCVEYSLLAHALLWAYGIPARVIGLKTSDVETRKYGAGHVVIEFWSNDIQKWIMSDVQAGIIPELDSVLLSAYELGQAIRHSKDVSYEGVAGIRFDRDKPYDEKPSYTEWVKEYLYFYDTPMRPSFADKDRSKELIAMLVPLNVTSPKMFQGMFEMNAQYTSSVLDFYAPPNQ